MTVEDLIRFHAADIAFVTEETPAADLEGFIAQLDTAATHFDMAGINGHENLKDAEVLLNEARYSADETAREVFLSRAQEHLKDVWDMKEEYRLMVGG